LNSYRNLNSIFSKRNNLWSISFSNMLVKLDYSVFIHVFNLDQSHLQIQS
jgi:hypothetical protein